MCASPVTLKERLQRGLTSLSLSMPQNAQQALLDYLGNLDEWNKVYNLTAIRDKDAMLIKHLFDSLSVVPFIRGEKMIDVGSGAGLPGIPLALYYPDKSITLLDSNGKKTLFLDHVRRTLGLTNVRVVQARVQEYAVPSGFDTIVCRAFASLGEIVSNVQHLLASGGQIIAMKGLLTDEELASIPPGFVVSVHHVEVPELNATRQLIGIER